MAEFCLDCWNKMNHIRLTQEDVILSEEVDLCEGCAEMRSVIIGYGKRKERPNVRRGCKERKRHHFLQKL